jgi:hypothetical protein
LEKTVLIGEGTEMVKLHGLLCALSENFGAKTSKSRTVARREAL